MKKKTPMNRSNPKDAQFKLGYSRGYDAGKRVARRHNETVIAALQQQVGYWREERKTPQTAGPV